MKVLVLDDNLDDLRQVRRVLSTMPNLDAVYLQDPDIALRKAIAGEVDVLVCDINIPKMSGLELVTRLRATESNSWLPTIFLTGADAERQAESLLRGGDAVLTKPLMPSLFMAQLQAFKRLINQRQKLLDEQRDLRHEANLDSLTGLWNRRGLGVAINDTLKVSEISKQLVSLLCVSIDGLKAFNEFHGNTAGDVAIQTVAGAVRYSLERNSDLAARIGQDEFLVCLPDTDVPGARRIAESIHQTFKDSRVLTPPSQQEQLSLSIGITCEIARVRELESYMEQATAAMYAAKNAAPNRVALYRHLADPVIYKNDVFITSGPIERLDG